jgi:electron transfer flavoprotein beta subunit
MNIIVCAKQIIDISEMKVDPNSNKPILQGIPKKVNDIDKNAVEEAIKIKEKHGGKITVITVGESDAKERIKELLAMGVDEGILIPYPEKYDYHVVSTLLAEAIKKIGEYSIIICGEASVDLFSGQVGPKIAGLLKIPQITYALNIDSSKDKLVAERNMGDKLVTTESTYPILVTVTKEINEPRLPSLMQILGAANKPINEWSAETLIDNINPIVETLELKGVSMERKNIIYKNDIDESIQQLVNGLAKEGVLR